MKPLKSKHGASRASSGHSCMRGELQARPFLVTAYKNQQLAAVDRLLKPRYKKTYVWVLRPAAGCAIVGA